MITQKLEIFAQRLEKACGSIGLTSANWSAGSRRTKNLLEINTSPHRTVLYVKDRSAPPGFWGLSKNQITALQNAKVAWHVILLVGDAEAGYLLPSRQVEVYIQNKWTLSKTDWKVHEEKLPKELRFDSFQGLFDMLWQGSSAADPLPTPLAADIEPPAQSRRVRQETYRVLRDTGLARAVKEGAGFRCQICGDVILLKGGLPYAEAHHVKPLGSPHDGPDVRENILCVCPNHHVQLDYGVITLPKDSFRNIRAEYIDYHNRIICGETSDG